jgi:hypothetical protein
VVLASTVSLGFGFFQDFACFEMGPPLRRMRILITTGHSPSTGAVKPHEGSGKFLLDLTSTVILGSEFLGTHGRSLLFHDSGCCAALSIQPYDEQFMK